MGHSGLRIKPCSACVPGENPFPDLPWLEEDSHIPRVPIPMAFHTLLPSSLLPLTLLLPSSKDTNHMGSPG